MKLSVQPSSEHVESTVGPSTSTFPSLTPLINGGVSTSGNNSTSNSSAIITYVIPIVAVFGCVIIVIVILWYRRSQLNKEHLELVGDIDRWMLSQGGNVIIRVVNEKDLKVEDSYNPGFDVSKLPTQKQAEAQAKVEAAASETNRKSEMSVIRSSVSRNLMAPPGGEVSVSASGDTEDRLSMYASNPLKNKSPVSPVVRKAVSKTMPSSASQSAVSLASSNNL